MRSCAGKAEIDMECEAQGHDMGVMLTEFEGRGIPGSVFKSILKKSIVNSR